MPYPEDCPLLPGLITNQTAVVANALAELNAAQGVYNTESMELTSMWMIWFQYCQGGPGFAAAQPPGDLDKPITVTFTPRQLGEMIEKIKASEGDLNRFVDPEV